MFETLSFWCRTWVVGWWRYRRCWSRRMASCGLTLTYDGQTFVPRIRSIGVGRPGRAHVRVQMLEGHCPADWENRTQRIAHAFGAQQCRAMICAPGTVELFFFHDADSSVRSDTDRKRRLGKGVA